MLKIESEMLEHRLLRMKVEVEHDRLARALRAAARRLSARTNIAGFRKGKAPYEIVRRHLGDNAVMDEALEPLTQEVYRDALEQERLEVAAAGTLDDVSRDPLVFTFSVPVRPLVDLGDYRSLRAPFTPPTVDEQEIERQMEQLREHQAIIDPVERPAQLEDVVVLNVSGRLLTADPASDAGPLLNDRGVSVLLSKELDWPGPGFAEHLIGIEAGETREVDYTFPADYPNPELAEKAAHITVEALEVKSREVPEWSDELAQEVGDFDTVADVREAVRRELQEQADEQAETAYRQSLIDKLVAGATVEYPQVLLDQEISVMLAQLDRNLRRKGLTLEDYYRVEQSNEEKVRAGLRPRAEARLARSLALGQLALAEGLSVPKSDLDDAVAVLSRVQRNPDPKTRRWLRSAELRQSLEMDALTVRALERLAAIAKGEAPDASSPAQEEAGGTPVRGEAVAPAAGPGGEEGDAVPAAGEAGEAGTAPAAESGVIISTDQTGPPGE